MIHFSSKLIEKAILEISKIPGIGKKSALRIVLFILKQDLNYSENLSSAIKKLREETLYCNVCNNISDNETCGICVEINRNRSIICVVENVQDVLAIENTDKYRGLYHVLGGLISPLDGIGPKDLNINSLIERINNESVNEIIFALSTTIEGDTTSFYIKKKLSDYKDIKISVISRGVSIGGEIEYTDEITLGNSIVSRVAYEN